MWPGESEADEKMRTLGKICLDRTNGVALQEQIATQIIDLIQQDLLRPHEMLPSTRELATQLRVSRNTVIYAYDRLASKGYVESRARSGLFVCALGKFPKRPDEASADRWSKTLDAEPGSISSGLRSPAPFRPSQPDVSLFPLLTWNRLRGRALRQYGEGLLGYQASCISGLPALRKNLAQYLRASRGVHCDWRQIVITSGSQQALYLLANLLVPRYGDRVYMEDPGYIGARLAWQSVDARIVPGALDEQGLQLPSSAIKGLSLIYTTPSRQFPTGASLSLARRLALLDYAARNKAWIIEDDYDSEFYYSSSPMPSLQSLDMHNRVIYLGTFSKVAFPALRIGYVVVPPELFDGFRAMKHLIDDHGPLIDQATLAMFLEYGAFHSHLRRCRKIYAERQSYFLEIFRKSGLPLEFPNRDGGMNLLGWLPPDADDRAWSKRLCSGRLDIPSLSSYSLKSCAPGLVFGFTAFTPQRMKSALEEVLRLVGKGI